MHFGPCLLLFVLSCHITSTEGLFFWRPASAFAQQQEHKASLGEYILQAFDGPGIPKTHETQPPTLKIKRMALVSFKRPFNYSSVPFHTSYIKAIS